MKKRIFAVLLALCLALALVPTAAFAADAGGFRIENGTLRKYEGPGGVVNIPQGVTQTGYPGPGEGWGAFQGNKEITIVNFPDSFTVIGNYTFWECTSLAKLTLTRNITTIGEHAFDGCGSLTTISIPENIVSLGSSVFSKCGRLSSVVIEDGREALTIPSAAFFQCGALTSVSLSDRVSSLGANCFDSCVGLQSITIPKNVQVIGSGVFKDCAGLTSVTILSTDVIISKNAFAGTSLRDVYFSGTEAQWNALMIDKEGNERLLDATIHYSSTGPSANPDPIPGTDPDPKPGTDPDPKPSADPEPTPDVKVTGVTISKTSLTMEPGQSETLTATVAPDAAENTAVTWSSNNPSVATVTSGGRVNALAAGAAVVTVKTDDGGFTATCRIIVKGEDKPGPVEVHFPRANVYNQGQFTDVPAQQWYTEGVKQAFEFGLMKGVSAKKFNPQGNVTLAEAITMAARIHSIYTTGAESFGQTSPWYQGYLDYAFQNGIISYAYYNSDVNKNATRAQFAEIFANSLPEEALAAVNDVDDGAIPDVPMTEAYAGHVYKLYRAGILAGGDARGTFSPNSYITRQECAAIVSRMAESNSRISFTLGA